MSTQKFLVLRSGNQAGLLFFFHFTLRVGLLGEQIAPIQFPNLFFKLAKLISSNAASAKRCIAHRLLPIRTAWGPAGSSLAHSRDAYFHLVNSEQIRRRLSPAGKQAAPPRGHGAGDVDAAACSNFRDKFAGYSRLRYIERGASVNV